MEGGGRDFGRRWKAKLKDFTLEFDWFITSRTGLAIVILGLMGLTFIAFEPFMRAPFDFVRAVERLAVFVWFAWIVYDATVRRQYSPQILVHSVDRFEQATRPQLMLERFRQHLERMRRLIRIIGSDKGQMFVRSLREEPSIPESERPSRVDQILRAIALHLEEEIILSQCIATKWYATAIREAIRGATQERSISALAIRDVLRTQFLLAPSWYRAKAMSERPGFVGFFERHPAAVTLLGAILPVVTATIVLVLERLLG